MATKLIMPRKSYCRKLQCYVNQTLVYIDISSSNRGDEGYMFSYSSCSGELECKEYKCQARYPQKSDINYSDNIKSRLKTSTR